MPHRSTVISMTLRMTANSQRTQCFPLCRRIGERCRQKPHVGYSVSPLRHRLPDLLLLQHQWEKRVFVFVHNSYANIGFVLFSCASVETHLSSLPSLVRFHFCLSSWSPMFLFLSLSCHSRLTLPPHATYSSFSILYISSSYWGATSANVHPHYFVQSTSNQCSFFFFLFVLGVNAFMMNSLVWTRAAETGMDGSGNDSQCVVEVWV